MSSDWLGSGSIAEFPVETIRVVPAFLYLFWSLLTGTLGLWKFVPETGLAIPSPREAIQVTLKVFVLSWALAIGNTYWMFGNLSKETLDCGVAAAVLLDPAVFYVAIGSTRGVNWPSWKSAAGGYLVFRVFYVVSTVIVTVAAEIVVNLLKLG